jgi:hypothetical protein
MAKNGIDWENLGQNGEKWDFQGRPGTHRRKTVLARVNPGLAA